MAIWVHKAVRVHEAEVLGLVVSRAACGDGLGDELIDPLPAVTADGVQDLDGLARVADGLGRELPKLGVRPQHDRDGVAEDDACSLVAAELGVVVEPEGLEEGQGLRDIGHREVDEELLDHRDLLWGAGRTMLIVAEGPGWSG